MTAATYDFIVIGAGSGGAVVAARLSENPAHQVMLLEVGQAPASLWSRLPIGVSKLIFDPRTVWPFFSGPEPELQQRRVTALRGKALGGSSAVNGMLWTRGDASAYDHWRDLGNPGWGFEDVLPHFRAIEDFPGSDPLTRGQQGPIRISTTGPSTLSDAYFDACVNAGLSPVADYNAGESEGVAYLQTNTYRGMRWGTYEGYLRKAMKRSNLHVVSAAVATQLTLTGQRVTGVQYRHLDAADLHTASARHEVVLSAGAYQTPTLLERSGIGRPDILQARGIAVQHALPGVGENLSDHLRIGLQFDCSLPTVNDIVHNPWHKLRAGLQYLVTRRGWLSTATMSVQAITRAFPESPSADVKLQLNAISTDLDIPRNAKNPLPVRRQSGFTMVIFPIYPRSRGHVHLRTLDPLEEPEILTHYLHDPYDQAVTVAGLRLGRRIAQQMPLAGYTRAEFDPGPACISDSDLLDFARAKGVTVYHPVGTCRMGQDAMAVVDAQLRVHGLHGLRIADASVMPTLPATNTNAASIMIGERAASWLIEAARTH